MINDKENEYEKDEQNTLCHDGSCNDSFHDSMRRRYSLRQYLCMLLTIQQQQQNPLQQAVPMVRNIRSVFYSS